MIKDYIVRAPFVVRLNEREVHRAGEVVSLPSAVAKLHLHKLAEVVSESDDEKPKRGRPSKQDAV